MATIELLGTTLDVKITEDFLGRGSFTGIDLGKYPQANKIQVTFSEKNILTSEGVMDWLNWTKSHAQFNNPQLILSQCPVTFVRQISSIAQFLPVGCVMESFYAPFYSEETSETKQALLKKGIDFGNDFLKTPECLDSKGNQMELDAIPEVYFGFLRVNLQT